MRIARVLAAGVALAVTAGCGGGGGDGGGGTGPSVFTSMSVAPSPVAVVVNATQALTVTARDQNNSTMSGLTSAFTTGNASIATVSGTGIVTGVAAGTTTITVTGTIGTVSKTTTVNVTVTEPGPAASVTATLDSKFDPGTVTVTAGGTVTWTFAMLHNVTFEGTGPTGGNIPNTASGSVQRTFPAAGTYNYHCTIHSGMSGTVVVQ